MVRLTINVSCIDSVIQIYDRVQLMKYIGSGVPSSVINLSEYGTVSGIDYTSNRSYVSDVLLLQSVETYTFIDPDGTPSDWYISNYYNPINMAYSAWNGPILGESSDIYYDPSYPEEIEYCDDDLLVIKRIRLLIGDPVELRREYGDDAVSSIHSDGRTYELDEKGWPASINISNVVYNSLYNPSVNGYKFLKFHNNIDTTTWSGCTEYGVDIWYYTFRHSNREIVEAYNICPPPPGLTSTTATSEAYMLQTSIDLLMQEAWEDGSEDGALIKDEGSVYDPTPGLNFRKGLLDKLQKRLDTLIKSLVLTRIEGVRID